jgi:hypothetical protein
MKRTSHLILTGKIRLKNDSGMPLGSYVAGK